MADIAIFRINYKSDFILTLQSDAGWLTPFCIKFWTGAPSQAYYAYYDGMSYTHCTPVDGEPTKLLVQFDDHHLPIGDLKFQIGYHFTVADFPTSVEDEVINQASVIIEVDNAPAQVMLDFNGETAPEIQFALPAYVNEAQRIANEQARIAAEEQRIANEQARISAEETRQANEQQRINAEAERVSDFASLKTESEAATAAANIAATLANEKAQLADDKAALAQAAATLANAKAQLAADKAALAQAAATLANEKAALAQQKAEYAQEQGDAAKTEAETAHALNEEVRDDEEARDHAEQIRQQQEAARQQAEAQRVIDFNAQMQQQQTAYADAEAARDTAFDEAETERDAKVDAKVADITNLQAQIGYFACDTAAATAAKTIAATGYVLTTGGNIRIKMTNANTADSATLNINSTGAKALFYNGTQASSTNSWEAGEVVEVYYDGTNYQASNTQGGGNLGAQSLSINSNLTMKQWIDANEENSTFGEARSINNDRYYASDFIPVYEGDIITFIAITGSGDTNAKNNGGYVFYDSNKTAVSGVITMVRTWSAATRTVIVPEGISYFRFSGPVEASTISISRKFENLVVYEKDFTEKLSESLLSNKGRDDSYWGVRILTAASVSIENGDVVLSVIAKAGNNIAYYDMSHLEVGVQYRISFDYITTSGRNFDCGFYGTNVGTSIAFSNTRPILQNHSDHIFIDFEYSESTKYFGFIFGVSQEPGFTVTISNFSIIKTEQVEHILHLDDIDNSFNGGSSKVLGAEKGKELNDRLSENENKASGFKKLYLEYSGLERAHTNIYTKMVAKPYEGVKLYFKMPANCRAYLRTSWGIDVHQWTNSAVVLANGDIYTDTELYTHLMIGFYMLDENGNYISDGQYNPVPLLISMLESGEIAVYYKEYDNVIDRNTQAQQDCDALLIRTIGTENHALSKVMYPIITHISDTHSDVERYKQFMEFSDFIGASVAVHSGDVSAYNNGSGLTYIHNLSDQYNTPVTVCVGNHDAGGGGDYELINSVKDDYGYLESSDTITTHTYYYKDFDDIKLRIIALNYYEDGATSVFNITQEQITWFCSTLKSTPSDYGVIVVLHTPEVAVNQAEGYTKFSDGDLPSPGTISTYPMITDIVDAFISKGSINNTYTPTFKGSQVTITVNDSFSSVAAGVEFICFMTGHYHQDFVGYNNTSQKQLMLNVVSGIPLYTDVGNYTGAHGALVRRGKTITQDAFNVYGIDRVRKLVHIIRVGARRTRDGVVRDFMSIPYA